ncbi:hypothetical protein LG331_09840 [Vreelandella aquamarina]|uniref:hypothetical protein n=1 Tax=Vreelandella aquamarina TaxID=77097 RepID=UPI00384CE6A3
MSRLRLTEDSSVWYLLWSNQAALLSVVTLLQGILPFWQGIIPSQWFIIAGACLSTAAIILRQIKQPKARAKLEEKRGTQHG